MLHELGYLEKIIPPMKHARCLLQFNQYHKFTVDEHSLQPSSRWASSPAEDALGDAIARSPTNRCYISRSAPRPGQGL